MANIVRHSGLVDLHGNPLKSSAAFKKEKPPALGPSYGNWSGPNASDVGWQNFMASLGVVQFDLSQLTLQDFRNMRDHSQVNASLSVLSFMQHQSPWEIECENAKIRDMLTEQIQAVWTQLNRAMSQANWAGYCVSPETKVLCSDMVWRTAGSLQVGQEILAFDEERTYQGDSTHKLSEQDRIEYDKALAAGFSQEELSKIFAVDKPSRRYKTATIIRNEVAYKPCYRIFTDIGEPITASYDHPWLVWRENGITERRYSEAKGAVITMQWPGFAWVPTSELRPTDKIAHFAKPWETDNSRDAGWLAGIFDGEGWISQHNDSGRSVPAWTIGVAQNQGLVLDKIKLEMAERGFSWRRKTVGVNGCENIAIAGGFREMVRFLGMIRPTRLLEKLPKMLTPGAALKTRYNFDLAKIKSIEFVGEREEVASITTSSGTFITGGYLSHNSPCILEYENDVQGKQVVLSKVKDLIPENCTVNWKQVEGKRLSPDSVPPKLNIYDGINQFGQAGPIPQEATFWYPILMQNGDYYGSKLLRPAFTPWYFSLLIHVYANRYYERYGEPTPIGRAGFEDEVTHNGVTMQGNDFMLQILSDLRSRSVVVLPNEGVEDSSGKFRYDYNIDFLESQMRGADFERYLNRLDEEISLSMFTPVLLMRTADVGSYNLGQGHMQVFLWIMNGMNSDRAFYIDKYILAPLVRYNYGINAPKATIKFRKLGDADLSTVKEIMTALINHGMVMPDLEKLGEMAGMDIKDIRATLQPDGSGNDGSPDAGEKNPDNSDNSGQNDGSSSSSNESKNASSSAKPSNIKARREELKSAIVQRVRPQVMRAFRSGKFDIDLSLGHTRELSSILADGGEQNSRSRAFAAIGAATEMGEYLLLQHSRTDAAQFMSEFEEQLEQYLEGA